jgi:co-chaperonin GroES (HSP10)
MATLLSGTTYVLLTVKSKFTQDFDKMIGMANLNPASRVNPADYVNIVGEIVAVPRSIAQRKDLKGYSTQDLQVGDTALFSYQVIYNIQELPDGKFLFRNQLNYKNLEVFRAGISQIFAVIRDGQIIMVNGYVMLDNISEPSRLVLATSKRMTPNAVSANVTAIGNPLTTSRPIEVEMGQTVYLDHKKIQHYTYKDMKFGIVQQRHIYAAEISC